MEKIGLFLATWRLLDMNLKAVILEKQQKNMESG